MERLAIGQLSSSMRALNAAVDNIRDARTDTSKDVLADVMRSVDAADRASICKRLLALVAALTTAIAEAEALESARAPPTDPSKPRAPLCLLSLRDYTGVQAAIELLLVWGVYPCVEAGILTPIERRAVAKTFKMDKATIQCVATALTPCATPAEQLDLVLPGLVDLLQLSQFKPMLLPSYLSDLLACLIYRVHCVSSGHPIIAAQALLDGILAALPIRVVMSSLRGVLAQRHSNRVFQAQCGLLLSQSVLRDGGVLATIEMLLSAVDEGNTQARLHVAALIARTPQTLSPAQYLDAIAPQVCHLLTQDTTKLLREVSGLVLTQLVLDHSPDLVDQTILRPLFAPLLRFLAPPVASTESLEIAFVATETDIDGCLAALQCILLGPVPPAPVLAALAPLVRPLVFLLAFARESKSYVTTSVQHILMTLVKQTPNAPTLLQQCVVVSPSQLTHRPFLVEDGAGSTQAVFCAGGSGGVAIKLADDDVASSSSLLNSVVDAIVDLLGLPQMDTCDVVGDLFTLLLTNYMKTKRAAHNDSVGSWTLLLRLTEALGPAVLRSGGSILQCLVTVLTMYTDQDANDNGDDGDDGDDVLTVCLSMVLTIVQVGETTRSPAEEALLVQMLEPLRRLASHPTPTVAEMASDLTLAIVARSVQEPPRGPAPITFDETLAMSRDDLASAQVPLRARGLARLTKWIRRRAPVDVDALFPLLVHHLQDADSYVFLAAVQTLAGLGDVHADVTIPMLLAALQDGATYSLEQRIKLSEALLFTARRCGAMVPKYSHGFVYGYLKCIRSTASQPDVVDATFRASCLSNLAEVCGLLQWAIQPYIADVVGCVKGILEIERQPTDAHTALRRGAVFLLYHMLQLMGRDMFEIVPEHMTPIYRLLKLEASTETDDVCRFHAQKSLSELDALMRGELFHIGRSTALPGGKALPSIVFLN
ncbi:Aste57867_18971 [Aphanomyces stellatus]|uniref:Aste57867_18971 protein n=1 Tax=Aphanomyces stellatus TaxID=120398 RepID=A0A485LCX3_9STRA|nr:hypothetical protein As57867_018907 [Aphanomyces stellatus]VFT95700.1 Aste57867_18971 [Aphanomyces stellatus]